MGVGCGYAIEGPLYDIDFVAYISIFALGTGDNGVHTFDAVLYVSFVIAIERVMRKGGRSESA